MGCGRRKVQPGERQEGKGRRGRHSWLKITEETGDCSVREREAEGAQTGKGQPAGGGLCWTTEDTL